MEANWCWTEIGDYVYDKASTEAIVICVLSIVVFCCAIYGAYKCNLKDPEKGHKY